jgi:tetratricopeptide (TPR) repeat protein
MKRFLLGFILAITLMGGIVYITVILPGNTSTNLLNTPEKVTEEPTYETPASETYRERVAKGDTLFEGGYFPLAAVEYEAANTLDPSRSEGFSRLGQARFYQEKYLEALEAFTKTLELNPEQPRIQLLLGETYLALEQFKNAQTHFNKLTLDNSEISYYRGVLAAYFGDNDAAKSHFNQVLEKNDDTTRSEQANHYLAAFQDYELAEDPHPSYLKTLIGQSLAETDQPLLAIHVLYDVLRDEPDYRDAWIILGYSYLARHDYKEAQEALFKAIELDPTKEESRYFLGLSYFGLDDYSSAVTQLELAIESGFEPKIQAYQKLGDAAVLSKEYKKAATAYENVLTLNSSDIELFIRPVWLNIDHLNNPERARILAEQAVLEHPSEAMGYNLLGWAQLTLNQLDDAEHNLNYALIIDPNLAAAHFNLGRWYHTQDKLDEAKSSFKQAYTIDPGGPIGNLAAEKYNEIVVSP